MSGRRPWVVLLLLILVSYAWMLFDLGRGLVVRDHLLFGLLVAAVAGFLTWERRDQIAQATPSSSRLGWLLLAFSVAAFLLGTRVAVIFPGGMTATFLRYISLITFIGGTGLLFFGRDVMRPLWLPFILLLFVVPPNFITASWLPLKMQTVATLLSQGTASAMGMDVIREGSVLRTRSFSANVAEACSGIRSLNAILPAALFLAGTGLKRVGPKVVLVLLAAPIAIFANSFRITTTLFLGTNINPDLAHGFFHTFAGLGIFVLALVCLFVCLSVLKVTESSGEDEDMDEDDPEELEDGENNGEQKRNYSLFQAIVHAAYSRRFVVLCVMLGLLALFEGSQVYAYYAAPDPGTFPDEPLDTVPLQVGPWQGTEKKVNKHVWRLRDPTDVVSRVYQAPGRPPVSVSTLYWEPGADPEMRNLRHSIEVCGPHQGMKEQWLKRVRISVPGELADKMMVRVAGYTGGGQNSIVTSCEILGTTSLDTSAGRAWRGYFDQALYGIKALKAGPAASQPGVAFQLSTPTDYGKEEIIPAHKALASRLISETLEAVYAGVK